MRSIAFSPTARAGRSAEARGPPTGIAAIERLAQVGSRLSALQSGFASAHAGVIKDSSGYAVEDVPAVQAISWTWSWAARERWRSSSNWNSILAPAARATSSVLGAFASIEAAVTAAVSARATGAVACELLDRTFLDVAASGGAPRPVPADTESALLAEVEEDVTDDASGGGPRQSSKIFRDAARRPFEIALDRPTETELWELRHAASPILAKLDPHLRSMQFIEDCAVPPAKLPEFVRGVRAILAANETRGVIFGHAGDAHVHVNPLVDVGRPTGVSEGRRDSFDAVGSALTASLGGTLTGEHGDGRLRTPLLRSRVGLGGG